MGQNVIKCYNYRSGQFLNEKSWLCEQTINIPFLQILIHFKY